jgi:hypothetical protein
MNEDARLGFEEAIDIFKSAVCCLWVEKICDRDEGKTDDRPDDPEFVAQAFNAW